MTMTAGLIRVVLVLIYLSWGVTACRAQRSMTPGRRTLSAAALASPPRFSAPGAATDCYIGNGTACDYLFGECQYDSDCSDVLAAALTSYGVTSLPPDFLFACFSAKCALATPSTPCVTTYGLPLCSPALFAPGPAPAEPLASPPAHTPVLLVSPPPDASAPQPPPAPPGKAVFAALCSTDIAGSGTGCCIEFGGSCQTFSDCDLSIAAYFKTAAAPLSSVPGDSIPACFAGKCYYASESTLCSALGEPLSTCSDGDTCLNSVSNLSSVSPPPAVDVHMITAGTAIAPASAAPVAFSSSAPTSATTSSADGFLSCLSLAAITVAVLMLM